jgi:hypothetical protein
MAIKVGGTTVIDDSRALSNIASVDAATVNALSTAGAGLPSQTGNTGKVLTTDGSAASWTDPGGGSYEVISNASYSITSGTAPQFSFTQDKKHIVELFDLYGSGSGIRPYLNYYNASNVLQSARWIVWQNEWSATYGGYSPQRDSNSGTSARFTFVDLNTTSGNRSAFVRLSIYQPNNKQFIMRGEALHPYNGDPYDETSGHCQTGAISNVSYIKVVPNGGTMNFRMRVLREA